MLSSDELKSVIDLLQHDARPTFIVDTSACDATRVAYMPVVHCNAAVSRYPRLLTLLSGKGDQVSEAVDFLDFGFWATSITRKSATADPSDGDPSVYTFHDLIWTVVPVQNIYLIVSGLPKHSIKYAASGPIDVQDGFTRVSETDKLPEHAQPSRAAGLQAQSKRQDDLDSPRVSAAKAVNAGMAALPYSRIHDCFFNTDWASTSLGPLDSWPSELHTVCALAMADPQPAVLYLGDEFIVVHNEAAVQFSPQIEGSLMGRRFSTTMPEAWKSFQQQFDRIMNGDHLTESINGVNFLLLRDERLDEAFIDARYMPIMSKSGKCLGVYQSAREVTHELVSKRRLGTLLDVNACATNITDEKAYWARLVQALSACVQDVAFAMVYSLDGALKSGNHTSRPNGHKVCKLEETMNVSHDHPSARSSIDLEEHSSTGYAVGMKKALNTDAPVYLDVKSGQLTAEDVSNIVCRGYKAPCQGATVLPIRPTGGTQVVGFLIIGISERVAYNDEYRQFIEILNRNIAYSVASLILFNEEAHRNQEREALAAKAKAQLEQSLQVSRQQLVSSEARFQLLTEKLSVGISISDNQGNLIYANEIFYALTGHPGIEFSTYPWIEMIHEDSQAATMAHFEKLWQLQEHGSFETKMKKKWIRGIEGAETITTDTWLLISATFETGISGDVSLVAALTDISAQKWAEAVHHRRMVEALELKTQQENFIDTISHEIRNPLSAILQCADEISGNIILKAAIANVDESSDKSNLEAIETIVLCCQHQRRVIDDVLMLSKINSKMLEITLVETDPQGIIQNVMKMFSGQARKHDILLTSDLEESLLDPNMRMMLLDPNRVSQVLINLISNAIKFTRECDVRQISLICGLSLHPPQHDDDEILYMAPSKAGRPKTAAVADTGSGDSVYLRIIVKDTGIGMSDEEKKNLFKRFSQASPRTYVRYGGSGLGLFISKQICELQGGAIGLKMGDDKGTTFGFYVKATLCENQDTATGSPSLDPDCMARALVPGTPPEVVEEPLFPVPAKRTSESSTGQIYTLLVVEDNLINQRVMCKQLRQKGFVVYAANHGQEALDFLRSTSLWKGNEAAGIPLSLILLDIEMPIMDGLVCVKHIRELESNGSLTSHVPIISVSANARLEQVEKARVAGMDDNISKPFRIDELDAKIDVLLRRSRDP